MTKLAVDQDLSDHNNVVVNMIIVFEVPCGTWVVMQTDLHIQM